MRAERRDWNKTVAMETGTLRIQKALGVLKGIYDQIGKKRFEPIFMWVSNDKWHLDNKC